MSNVPGVITVTSAETGCRLCFHTDFVSRVTPQRSGSMITVRGLGKVHTVECFRDVGSQVRILPRSPYVQWTPGLQVAVELLLRHEA